MGETTNKRTFEIDTDVISKLDNLLKTSGITDKKKLKELETKIVNKGIMHIYKSLSEEQ